MTVRQAVAQALVVGGAVCIVVAVGLLAGGLWALLVGGLVASLYGLLLVEVPARPVGGVAASPGDVARFGR